MLFISQLLVLWLGLFVVIRSALHGNHIGLIWGVVIVFISSVLGVIHWIVA